MPFEYIVLVAPASQPEADTEVAPDDAPAPALTKSELCSTAASAAEANRLPVRFFANLIEQESGFKPHVVSSAGAQGIAQFMPEVAAERGLDNPFDPVQSLRASARFIADLVGQFGNVGLAAAAYNAGSRRVNDWLRRRGKLPAETRDYVRKITGRPAEKWVRVHWKVGQLRLPARAQCPELLVADVHVPAKRKLHHGKARLAVAAASRPVRIAARPVRHEKSPTHHRVRLAAQ